jgi:fused signal recognition particle receptor
LKLWGDRLGLDTVVGAHGADAAAVAFDCVQAGLARKADVVIIDTAGRMHTKQPLMEELQKVRRSVAKAMPGAPHESWIVLDATLGNNAVIQARMFKECVALTGVIVAKLDGSSKAGFVFTLRKELGLPVRYVGLGEGADDLAPFDAGEFVKGFLGI